MNSTKKQLALLCALVCSLFFSKPLLAEESYERFTERTWTYRDGTQAMGKLITVSGPVATLRLEGKGTVRIPLEQLSVKDLNWIYEYHKRKKQLSFLPPEYRKPLTEAPEIKPETEPSKPAETENKPDLPEKKMTPAEQETDESYKPFTVRKWTLKDGTHYEAKFLSLINGKVHLQKQPVDLLQVSLDQLSQQDLDWVIEYHRRNKLLVFLPKEYQGEKAAGDPLAGGSPAKVPPVKFQMNNPIKAGQDPLAMAREKAKAMQEKHQEEMRERAKATARDGDPNVIKANTEIDPVLVAALRDFRVWSDKKGQKSEAIFTRIDGREALFHTRTAGLARVHIGTLVDEDLQLLRDALKMHGRFDEIPLVYREPLDPDLSPTKLKQILRVNDHRKWTDLTGNSVGASYIKMEEGNVFLLITKTSAVQEFPYLNFIPEDQEYVQERLKKEIPGNFFPAGVEGVELSLTPEEREKEFRIWTDRSKRQLKGKFDRLAYGDSVAVINTGDKEELFITEFFSDQDLSLLKPRKQKQADQLAMNGGGNNPAVPGGGIPGRMRFPGGMNRGMSGNVTGAMSGGTSFPQSGNRAKEIFEKMNQGSPDPGIQGRHRSRGIFPDSSEQELKLPQVNPGSGLQFQLTCPLCDKTHLSNTPNGGACPHCGAAPGDKYYKCTICQLKFKADGNGEKAPCPHCNSGFLGNVNLWTALVKLLVVIVLASGGYYRFSR
tara:strand:+ start:24477 stop:26630 length:2154 start_codon:yes stop_codon:yes gene_type:complete